jgi:hypothetical protein
VVVVPVEVGMPVVMMPVVVMIVMVGVGGGGHGDGERPDGHQRKDDLLHRQVPYLHARFEPDTAPVEQRHHEPIMIDISHANNFFAD